ncbi:MAG: DUF3108 domain-containing protein [bacterium]
MRKIIFLKGILLGVLLAFLLLALNALLVIKPKIDKYIATLPNLNTQTGALLPKTETFRLNHIGEKIIYGVRLGKLSVGEARFSNIADEQVNGRILSVMLVETQLTRFRDTEKIYSDPRTLLPVRVERDILNWFVREKITEEYDQDNFTVTIIKEKGGKTEKTVIKKDSPIHNAILLPYYVRGLPDLEIGKIIVANLPTRKLEIKLVSLEDIAVPAGTFKAYHFQSTPRQIDIWITNDERRIPVKIQGTGLLGYSMAMKKYTF